MAIVGIYVRFLECTSPGRAPKIVEYKPLYGLVRKITSKKIDIVNLNLRRISMEFDFFVASMFFNNMFVGEYSQMDRLWMMSQPLPVQG